MRLSGLKAVISGGGSGIGEACVDLFVGEGAVVGALDLHTPPERDSVIPLWTDVRNEESVRTAVDAFVARAGGLDLLVNSAGIGATGTIEANDDQEWLQLFKTNVLGVVHVSRAALPHLKESRCAAIVNLSSIAAIAGLPERACYTATKGAVHSLSFAMAADHLADGIRVNCICPGTADTPWVERLLRQAGDAVSARTALEQRQPMGRLATANEVATGILSLIEPAATFITGTALSVDGGMAGLRLPSGGAKAADSEVPRSTAHS
jgi:2-keto-3-deoxy-L-fuconate dehydrogenase